MIRPPLFLIIAAALTLLVPPSQAWGQCSDAGVCVVGKHRNAGHSLGLSYNFGSSGKESTFTVHAVRLEVTYRIFENSDIHLELPFSSQSGPAGSAGGIGDLVLLWNQEIFSTGGALRIQGGARLATGGVNANTLPQAYQSGLGTNDFLLGASYETNGISVAAAYQITTGRSANRLTRLKRGDDLMVRAGYTHRQESYAFGGELLAIKRIQESTILSATQPEAFVNVPNSNQLQLNLVGHFAYTLDENYLLQAQGAFALLKRDTNVDGLKRTFTLSLGLTYAL